jgi:hypothetical protein
MSKQNHSFEINIVELFDLFHLVYDLLTKVAFAEFSIKVKGYENDAIEG